MAMPQFFTEDGCRIFYKTDGTEPSRPWVVFLNGFTLTTVYWQPMAKLLAGRFRLLCYDARGQGRSGLGKTRLSLALHVADLRSLLDHLSIARAHLVGLSHGARIALAYGARFPEQVARLVLCSPVASPSDPGNPATRSWLEILAKHGMNAMARDMAANVFGPVFIEKHRSIMDKIIDGIVWRNSKAALVAQLAALAAYPPAERFAPNVRDIPSLVITGSDDPLVKTASAVRLASLCGGRHLSIHGAGHSVPVEAPKRFENAVVSFLDDPSQGP